MTKTITASGLLTERDIKQLTRRSRGGSVGPTAVYYAGLTGPMISAGTALTTGHALKMIGANAYWQLMLSALIAAFAGIAWYLIFIRWSYRHKIGRGTEMSVATEVSAARAGLTIIRGDIETKIGWPAIRQITISPSHIVMTIKGTDALIIPNRWFGDDLDARQNFLDIVATYAPPFGSAEHAFPSNGEAAA